MTPEARNKMERDLDWKPFHLERRNCRDEAERRERDHEIACIKRDLSLIRTNKLRLGEINI